MHKWGHTVLTPCSTTLNHSLEIDSNFWHSWYFYFQHSIDLVASTRFFVTLSLTFSHTCVFNLYIFIIISPWLSNKSLAIVSLEVTLLQVILLSLYHQIHWKKNICSVITFSPPPNTNWILLCYNIKAWISVYEKLLNLYSKDLV